MRIILAVLLTLAANFSYASIGNVSDTKGAACSIERNKQKLSGEKGAIIESNDTYVTGGCQANITFKDDTKVKVTENSRLLIDDFVYDPKKSDAGKLAIKAAMGTVRYTSGQIAKNNPQAVDVKTPTATIAVRGTDFNMTVDEAGQSLVILVPSCKDESEVKKYELEENRCKVGKIEVTTLAGTVSLDRAFEATFVTSASMAPSPPVVINTIEAKINNNLIIVKPTEVQKAVKEQGKTKQEREAEELEAEAARRLAQLVKENGERTEKKIVVGETFATGQPGCNPAINICVKWENPDQPDIQSKGRGIAYRNTDPDHYAEVKTQGYDSNTQVVIIHNDAYASELIGPGGGNGNNIYIKQNTGVLRR